MSPTKVGAKKTVKNLKTKKKYENSTTRCKRSFELYIYKVLKQVHPDLSVTKKAMNIMNSFINDIFDRIILEVSHLVRFSDKKRKTLRPREIQTAVKLLFPGKLVNYAIKDGVKALTNYNFYFLKQQQDSPFCNFQVQK
ncbi:unnamed protein product [Paramecium pentaurelia]|uniref:Core Histone H2A/H2B/H3 domain-containing protein n=1 Tax=Paramecium pentaurelia TaxID=43138 RepID=A0A8S1V207_9CILI|nr:unnamed protein product [Paramecium pentaurelia]